MFKAKKFQNFLCHSMACVLCKGNFPSTKEINRSHVLLAFFCLGATGIVIVPHVLPMVLLAPILLTCFLLAIKMPLLRPVLFLFLGISWLNYHAHTRLQASFPEQFERVELQLEGSVIGLPKVSKDDIRFRFKVSSTSTLKLGALVGQSIQLSCYRCPLSIAADQQWRFTVRLKRPHGYASWGAFDYEKYLFRHHLVAKGYIRIKGSNKLIGQGYQAMSLSRQKVRDRILHQVPDSVGRNMIVALAIGDKSGFSKQQQLILQNTGVSHLMAISGLHIGLVFLSVAGLFKWLLRLCPLIFEIVPRAHLILIPAFLAACLYASLAGFAVSTQRALVMLAVYVFCKLSGRPLSLLQVLVLAATILIVFDPFSVLDSGFWLSCGAVAFIALVCEKNKSTSLIKLQPSLWLGMMPLSMVLFAKVSLASPIVNLLLVPIFCFLLIPLTLIAVLISSLDFNFIMSIGFISNLVNGFLPLMAIGFDFIFSGLQWVSALSVSSRYTTPLLFWQWLVYAALMFMIVKKRTWMTFVLSVFFITSILLRPIHRLSNDELHVLLLDVGQGLSMVVETPNSVLVYDTGPRFSSGFTASEAVLLPYLRSRGVDKIDTLIISHADNDHIGGYHVLQDNVEVGRVLSSRVDKLPESEQCQAGQQWSQDMTEFKILGPNSSTPKGSNNHSCVLKIEHKGTSVLITGDIEKQVEKHMILTQADDLSSNIMLVPHQGSKTSSTIDFLDTVKPQIGLLAAGYKNHYGHPHADVMARYKQRKIKVFSTIDSGSILLKINSQGWRVIEYRNAKRKLWFN